MDHRFTSDSADSARVLFVDDLPELRRTGGRALRLLGHVVVEADGGRAALDAADEQPFDLVLSDVMMPDVDGLQLLRCLRERHPLLPVVLMSAKPSDDDARQARELGAFAYLAKPITSERLRTTVASALAARRAALGAGARAPLWRCEALDPGALST